MKKNIKRLTLIISIFYLTSCQKDNKTINYDGTYLESGSAIVVNEGTFGSPNASASFISRNGTVYNDIYGTINGGVALGDVFQSYSIIGNKGICILNNSKKIEIVDARSFRNIGTIIHSTITYPRYSVAKDTSRIYVSNGSSDGTVLVINPSNQTVIKTINVGKGPEQMLIHNNNLYVANSGGFGVDSTISIINLSTETETQKIVVGDVPTKLIKDANGNIWVLCNGQSDYDNWPNISKLSPAKLIKINTSNNTIDKTITIIPSGSTDYTGNLTIGNNGQTLYYNINETIYTMPINATSASNNIFTSGRKFYGMSAHPNNGQLYACYAPNFSSNGYVFRFNASGQIIDSLRVGIGPNSIIFNL